MKRSFLIAFILLNSMLTFSQFFEHAVSFEVRYPITLGENFMNNKSLGGEGYTGIIDAGAAYNILKLQRTSLGINFNVSILQLKEVELIASAFLPGIHAEHIFSTGNLKIVPRLGFGYVRWRFKGPDITYEDQNGSIVHLENKKTANGISMEGSLKFVYNNGNPVSLFIEASYSFQRLEKPTGGELNSSFNRNIQIFYPGAGLIWRF